MFAKLPASVPCCIGNSGTWNCGTGVAVAVGVAVVVAAPPPPPPTLWNRGAVVGTPPRVLPQNGVTPLIIEPGVG